MTKTLNGHAVATALVGVALLAIPVSAEAACVGDNCKRPIIDTKVNTSYKYNTVRKVQNVTRYKDIDRPHRVTNVHRIVNVTRVQPVTRMNVVTRVHNRTAILRENQQSSQTKTLPAQSVTTGKTMHMGGNIPSPKVSTSYKYNTVQKVNNVTKYKDVNHTNYVKHINRVVSVTQMQPVIRTNVVTRIHDRPVITSRNEYVNQTQMLPTRTITTGKTIQINHGRTSALGRERMSED